MRYMVRLIMDGVYKVYYKEYIQEFDEIINYDVYQGGLADCLAWIQLHEEGRM
jgi:hypothetical protein